MLIRSCAMALALAIGVFTASGAEALEVANGLSANGLSANGLSANGLTQNGLTQNGLTQNGLATNGVSAHGVDANLAPIESVFLQDGSLVVLK
jgi:hypothetical protein